MRGGFWIKRREVTRAAEGNKPTPDGRKIWRIEHDAGMLHATIVLPDTDPPTVEWILPNGTHVNGNEINQEVQKGETLCLCEDFSRCGADFHCSPVHLRYDMIPIMRPSLRHGSRYGLFKSKKPACVPEHDGTTEQRKFGATRLVIAGTKDDPSRTILTVRDLNDYLARPSNSNQTYTYLYIGHCPGFTGDLSEFTQRTQYFYLDIPNNDWQGPIAGTRHNISPVTAIHHTGVHGTFSWNNGCFGSYYVYGNPNMTPEDYDAVVIGYYNSIQSHSYMVDNINWSYSDLYFVISSRRTSASDEAYAALQALGINTYEYEEE